MTLPDIKPEAMALACSLIMDEEHYSAASYYDSIGRCWSQGYGFCSLADGSTVTQHSPPLSVAACQALLKAKLLATYLPPVIADCGWPLKDGQLAALGSLCWNCGPGAIGRSIIPQLARAGSWSGVRAAMQQFIHDHNGNIVPGLVGRRRREGLILLGATFLPGKRTGEPLGTPPRPPEPTVQAHPHPTPPQLHAGMATRLPALAVHSPMRSTAPDPQAGEADRLMAAELVNLGVPT